MRLSIIVAIAGNNAIGLDNKLIYWLPNDMKRFRLLTTGNTIIMGRKTFESLPKGALPNRRNIVLSRTAAKDAFPGAECFATLDEALEACRNQEEVFVIGGASVYGQALPFADRLCLTRIDDVPSEADTFFPEIDEAQWTETFREEHVTDEKHAYRYSFVNLERKK
ncbi:MAG: dihydrofolate reductase [Bacteroides sp.]|nr:dihydrofolate reductase [Roseburia sp.]MCM1346644.1 dihydrofolate reductase [Bacteroides sp.]MCM1419926.1 dihydrofolate reductase [Bacteroides sp.]